jgi:hypothetical protein
LLHQLKKYILKKYYPMTFLPSCWQLVDKWKSVAVYATSKLILQNLKQTPALYFRTYLYIYTHCIDLSTTVATNGGLFFLIDRESIPII